MLALVSQKGLGVYLSTLLSETIVGFLSHRQICL